MSAPRFSVLVGQITAIFVLSLLAVFNASNAFGQAVNATLLGTVADSSGASIAGAKVTASETNTGVSHTTTTNDSGNFTFSDLQPGTYSVQGEHPGFKREMRKGIQLDVNSTQRVDISLQPGEVTEVIEVSGGVPLLQTERADTGRTLEQVLIEELPMGVNRNFQTLLDLVPGTTPASFQHSQFFNAASSLQTQSNGNLRMGNNYQIEGIDNNERTGLLQILIPPSEAISQVSISTTNHDPELGRGTGAVTNVILKSGTNALHGQAYYMTQNSAWDARSYFNPTVGHLAYNYVGANAGGPVKHSKIFYFADYLRTMDHEANTNLLSIPSIPFRQGDLSYGNQPSLYAKQIVYDPATGDQTNGNNRIPFTGNIIPASRINPVAAKILSVIPPTNQPFNQTIQSNDYYTLLPAQKTKDSIDTKIDWAKDDRNRFVTRFSFAKPVTFQAPAFGDYGGPAQGAFAGTGYQKTYSSGINWNRIISPTLITEVRVGVAYYHNEAQPTDYGKNDAEAVGIPGVNLNPFTSGMVGINFSSNFSNPMVGYAASLPWVRAETNADIVNSWTKTASNHTIKFGIDLRILRDALLQDQTYSPRGIMNFGTNQTSTPGNAGTGLANDMASFLLGIPSTVSRDVNTYFPSLHSKQIFGYVADMWQVNSRLTINGGLRWELYPPPTPEFPGGFSNYNPVNNTLVIAGVANNPSNLGMKTRWKNFAPRLGIAYRLDEKTVLRTGFGISYGPYPDNNYAYNYPVRSNNVYNTAGGSSYLGAILPNGQLASFQNGFPTPLSVPIPSNGIITNPDPTSTYYVVPTDFKNPYVETWNVAVQRSLPLRVVLDVAYVGSHGVDSPATVNLNAGQIVNGGNAGKPGYAAFGRTGDTNLIFAGFSSSYHSLQVKADRRFAGGLAITTSFTWSKAMSFQTGDDGGLYYSYAPMIQRGYTRADFDRKLNFVQSYVYQIPFGKGRRYLTSGAGSKLLGGWSVSGILSYRSGTPFTVTASSGLNLPNFNQTANLVGDYKVPGGIGNGVQWFDTSAFSAPAGVTFGNTGRNEFTGPNLFSLNAGVRREFRLTERFKVEFRAEALNATNTPQFANPSSSYTSSTFGSITGTLSTGTGVNGTGGGRNLNLSTKISF